jgi:hypothetical protein
MGSLGPADLAHFRSEGWLRLAGSKLHAASVLRSLQEQILGELARLRIWERGRSAGSALDRLPAFQQIARLSSMVKLPQLHAALGAPALKGPVAELAALLGQAPADAPDSQLLLSLPRQGAWSLDHLNWHVDVAAPPGDRVPGIQVFYLIGDVVPRGGATLALARSHRLEGEAMHRLRGVLKGNGDLPAALSDSGTQIVEMSGRAGDLFLMDMRVLHTPSVNESPNIRMMATTRFGLKA